MLGDIAADVEVSLDDFSIIHLHCLENGNYAVDLIQSENNIIELTSEILDERIHERDNNPVEIVDLSNNGNSVESSLNNNFVNVTDAQSSEQLAENRNSPNVGNPNDTVNSQAPGCDNNNYNTQGIEIDNAPFHMCRTRKGEPLNWKANKAKRLRNQGLSYEWRSGMKRARCVGKGCGAKSDIIAMTFPMSNVLQFSIHFGG